MATSAAPGTSSPGRKSRPSSGCTPNTRKKSAVTWTPSMRSGAPAPNSAKLATSTAALRSKTPDARQRWYSRRVTTWGCVPKNGMISPMVRILPALGNGKGRNRTAFTTLVFAEGNHLGLRAEERNDFADGEDPAGAGEWQGPQQDRVHHAEHNGGRRQTDGQRQYGGRREAGVPAHAAQRVPEFPRKPLQRE